MRMTAAYRCLQIEIEDKAKRFQLGVSLNAGCTMDFHLSRDGITL
jgi:hypothetical protein